MSEISDFREYVEEQQQLCYGVELGGTPAVVGSLARQYDFLLETIDTYQEINQPQLSENQQIVLEWLKKEYFQGYGPAIIRTIHLLQRENSIDISGSKAVTQAYRSLNTAEEAVVVKMFADWALGQEEE